MPWDIRAATTWVRQGGNRSGRKLDYRTQERRALIKTAGGNVSRRTVGGLSTAVRSMTRVWQTQKEGDAVSLLLAFPYFFSLFLPLSHVATSPRGNNNDDGVVISRCGSCNFDGNFFAGRTTQLTKLPDMNLLKNSRRDAEPPGIEVGDQAARLRDIMERVS